MKVGKNFVCIGEIEPFNRDWVTIGDDCLLGGQSKIILHGPIRPYKSNNKVVFEDLTWIGFRVLILPGTRIGRASLIGAASVVFGDIPPYSIAVGNPVKVIKRREPYELLRWYTIRIKMDAVLGTVEPDFSLLTMQDVKYLFGHGTESPYDPSLDLDNMTVQDVLSYATK